MTVKLHLFMWPPVPRTHFPGGKAGHLYSDTFDLEELHAAAKQVGAKVAWFQNGDNRKAFPHYDLWAGPLERAKALFSLASSRELYQDTRRKVQREPAD